MKSSVNKKDNDNEINDDRESIEDNVRGWKAELLKFKSESDEFNREFEKAMVRRVQQKNISANH